MQFLISVSFSLQIFQFRPNIIPLACSFFFSFFRDFGSHRIGIQIRSSSISFNYQVDYSLWPIAERKAVRNYFFFFVHSFCFLALKISSENGNKNFWVDTKMLKIGQTKFSFIHIFFSIFLFPRENNNFNLILKIKLIVRSASLHNCQSYVDGISEWKNNTRDFKVQTDFHNFEFFFWNRANVWESFVDVFFFFSSLLGPDLFVDSVLFGPEYRPVARPRDGRDPTKFRWICSRNCWPIVDPLCSFFFNNIK